MERPLVVQAADLRDRLREFLGTPEPMAADLQSDLEMALSTLEAFPGADQYPAAGSPASPPRAETSPQKTEGLPEGRGPQGTSPQPRVAVNRQPDGHYNVRALDEAALSNARSLQDLLNAMTGRALSPLSKLVLECAARVFALELENERLRGGDNGDSR